MTVNIYSCLLLLFRSLHFSTETKFSAYFPEDQLDNEYHIFTYSSLYKIGEFSMWLNISASCLHILHLLSSYGLSIPSLIAFIVMACNCTSYMCNPVSLVYAKPPLRTSKCLLTMKLLFKTRLKNGLTYCYVLCDKF